MKVCHTLICCFFLSLQDGNPVLVNAQLFVYSGIEGGNITVQCRFGSSGQRKFFCKGECKAENVLIATADVRAQRGRYSIRYEAGLITGVNLYVTITQLTKSDSGLYNCGLGTTQISYTELEIIVIDAQLDGSSDPSEEKTLYTRTGGTVTVECSFTSFGTWRHLCKDRCRTRNDILVETRRDTSQRDRYSIRYLTGSRGGFLFVTITQLNTSDSGRYWCGQDRLAASRSHRNFQIIVEDAPVPSTTTPTTTTTTPTASTTHLPDSNEVTTTTKGVMLYVGLTLAVLVVLLLAAVLIVCRKRTSTSEETTVETEYASVTEANQVYEDIRESRSPPVGISSGYTCATYTKPNGIQTSDGCSFVTAASSQHNAEEDSSKLTYTEVNFSNRTVSSPNSAPRHNTNDVIYSVPRVEASPDGSPTGDDPPLYSNVTRRQ